MPQTVVYFIKLERPIGNPSNPHGLAEWYCGSTNNLKRRIAQHLSGSGAALLRAANERGIKWEVKLVIPGDFQKEIEIKKRKNTKAWLKANYPHVLSA